MPDIIELVRRSVAADAERIAGLSEAVASGNVSEEVRQELLRINADSQAHLAALGGIYVSGLPTPEGEVEPVVEPGFENSTVEDVIEALNTGTGSSLAQAVTDPSGSMARLLAAISVSRGLAADRLTAAAGMENFDSISNLYEIDGGVPLEPVEDPDHYGLPDGDEATGLSVADFAAIVQSEDAARYAFEVFAARSEGDLRTALRNRARVHGLRAQAWGVLGQIAETDQDPRVVAYQIPTELTPAELVLFIEKELSVRWASLIAAAAPGSRGPLLEALIASQLTVAQWGGAIATFPGMPDVGDRFGGWPLFPDEPRIPYEWAADLNEPPIVEPNE